MLNLFQKKGQIFDDIILDRLGDPISVKVRHSFKARHFSIKIRGSQPELVLPNSDIKTAHRFLLEKESWIRKKLHLSKKIQVKQNVMPIFGKEYNLQFIDSNCYDIKFEGSNLEIHSNKNHHKKTLLKYLKDRILLEIKPIIHDISENYNLPFSQIRIMNNKTKWGSCSSKGVLSFHWRIIFAPKNILHYLIIHEMCHITHMNHSKDFWDMVESIDPDYKKSRLWLKRNGALLHAYLV